MALPALLRKYRKIEFPDSEWFVIVDPQGVDDGPFRRDEFVRERDGSYVAQTPGRPLLLRCVAKDGAFYVCEDGGGRRWRYRLQPVAI